MLVSVIIPFHNCGESLHRTMHSVVAQTHSPLEVLLVDDGSADNSYSIAKAYENEWIKVLRQPNAGAAIARNTGLAASRGEYIQFLDAGDAISPEKIRAQVMILQANPGKLAVCNYRQFTRDEEIADHSVPEQSAFIYSSDDSRDFLIRLWGGYGQMNFIQTNCWLVPRILIDKAGPWRHYRCPDDDGEFFARVLLASEGIVHTPGVLNYYHITPSGRGQLSRNTNRKYLQNTLLTIDLKHDYLKKNGSDPRIDRAIASQYLQFAVNTFPSQSILSKIAFQRYLHLNVNLPAPLLGGRFIEFVKHMFGWRAARMFRYFFREIWIR